jgi:hypothetical protein
MDLHMNIKIMTTEGVLTTEEVLTTEGGLQETLPRGSALFHLLVQRATCP